MDIKNDAERLIRARHSCRTFLEKPLDEGAAQQFAEWIQRINDGSHPFRFVWVRELDGDVRLGTYGAIRGASSYVAGIVPKGCGQMHRFGFLFEQIVLAATALGFGTCWLAGIDR